MQIQKDREYLKYLESQGEGKINWDVWDRMVEEFHKWMQEYFSGSTSQFPKNKSNVMVYTYDSNGNFIEVYDSNSQAAIHFQVSNSIVHTYSKKQGVLNGYLLSREKLTKDVAFALYRRAIESGQVFQTGITRTKAKKTVYVYNHTGKMIGVYESLPQFCNISGENRLSELRSRMLEGDIITNGRLLSFSFYDDKTAEEQFKITAKLRQHVIQLYNVYKDGQLVLQNAKTSKVIHLVPIKASTLRNKLNMSDFLKVDGYIITKYDFKGSDGFKTALNAN